MQAKDSSITMKYVQTSESWNESPQADLHWPLLTSKLIILEHMHVPKWYQKKAEHQRISYVKTFLFCSWPLTSHGHDLTSHDFFGPLTSGINSAITKTIGVTAVLQWKYVQTSERWNYWPKADLHLPLMTPKLCVLEHLHDVYKKA